MRSGATSRSEPSAARAARRALGSQEKDPESPIRGRERLARFRSTSHRGPATATAPVTRRSATDTRRPGRFTDNAGVDTPICAVSTPFPRACSVASPDHWDSVAHAGRSGAR